jgi:hypothetical protein
MRRLRVNLRVQSHGLPCMCTVPGLRHQESAAHQQGGRLSEVPGALLFLLRTLPRVRFDAADRLTALLVRPPQGPGKTGSNRRGLGVDQAQGRWLCARPGALGRTEFARCLAQPFALEMPRSIAAPRARRGRPGRCRTNSHSSRDQEEFAAPARRPPRGRFVPEALAGWLCGPPMPVRLLPSLPSGPLASRL